VTIDASVNLRGKHSKYAAYAFTEQGVAMLSSILRSKKAIQVNISIMRAFVIIRQNLVDIKDLKAKVEMIERDMNLKFDDIYQVLNYLINPRGQRKIVKGYRK
jgi:hypothetical protein